MMAKSKRHAAICTLSETRTRIVGRASFSTIASTKSWAFCGMDTKLLISSIVLDFANSCYDFPCFLEKLRINMRYFWIDTDMGSDDAVALMMAFRAPDVEVVGISVLAGNVPLEQGGKNARFLAELCGAEVPVYLGAAKPLLRSYVDATWFHGADGLAGRGGTPQKSHESRHAVEALIEAVNQY